MTQVIRNYFLNDLSTDSHSYPCPRCRCISVETESHPATGQITTCHECGARGYTEDWNNGCFDLDKVKGEHYYKPIELLCFKRPEIEKIIVTGLNNDRN